MNYLKTIYAGVCGALFLLSCTDADDTIGLKQSTAGAYVTVLSIASSSFDVKRMDAAYFELTVRAWDEQKGGLLQSYNFSVRLLDNTKANGTTETVVTAVKTIPASAFSPDKTTGLPSATIRITAAEAMDVLGITAADVAKGDVFQFLEELVLTDGRRFNDPNTSVEVGSSAFYKSPFYHNVTVVDN